MIIDTHCHLTSLSSSALNEQLNPEHLYLTMGTHVSDWPDVIHLSKTYSNVFSALGLHPWYVTEEYESELETLQQQLLESTPTAIGEIGLDFSPDHNATRKFQLDAFECQLKFALEYDLPVSLHVYKAHNETIELLKRYPVRGVVHSLGCSVQLARQYVDLGFKFGVNAILARDNARRYHELVREFGLECVVLETDSPNIRLPAVSETNLADILQVVNAVSEITGSTALEVVKRTEANANQIFHFLKD
ncbi:TatD family hydrolase [Thiomicrorhabdus sp.]|uniref:TatD family hydrolase n=1 Tax=Thiomicrorhabdus sp. TaxID=2039724 RepID=UPI0035618134